MYDSKLIQKIKEEYQKEDHGDTYAILEPVIKECMKYLNRVIKSFSGQKPDVTDLFNAVVWAIDIHIAQGDGSSLDDATVLSRISIDLLSSIYEYRTLSDEELTAMLAGEDDVIVRYVIETRKKSKADETEKTQAGQKKPNVLSWLSANMSPPAAAAQDTSKYKLSIF